MISYSGWGTFQKCQFKYRLRYIEKSQAPKTEPSPAVKRGLEIHQSVEDFLHDKTESIHPEIQQKYGQYFYQLKENNEITIAEEKWAYDHNWQEVGWDDEGMVRGMWDTYVVENEYSGDILVLEYKTGNVYPDHQQQRDLYACAAASRWFEYDSLVVETIYFDKNKRHRDEYSYEKVDELKQQWKNDIQMIEIAEPEDMIPNPTYLCRYCEYSKANGGPCQF